MKKILLIVSILLGGFLLSQQYLSTPAFASNTCTEGTITSGSCVVCKEDKTCGTCGDPDPNQCNSIWKSCTYVGSIDGNHADPCSLVQDELCDGSPKPNSCKLPLSCNCDNSKFQPATCANGSVCTGEYNDPEFPSCNFCQSWFKPVCQPDGACLNKLCDPNNPEDKAQGCGISSDPCSTYQTIACTPNVNLKANNSDSPPPIGDGSSVTLSWKTKRITIPPNSCTASGAWSGGKSANASEVRGPAVWSR